jgi:branched-chain amino acid transport system permease protein
MISTLFIGFSLGCVYALVAIGYSLIHQTTNAINLAQGAIVMIGGMSASWFLTALGVVYPLAIAGGILCGGILGLIVAKFVVLPLWNRNIPQIVMLLATMVVSWMVENIVLHLLGYIPHSLPSWSAEKTVSVLGASVNPHYFWIMAVSLVIVGALQFFLNRTMLGRAMRTTALNREVASLVGISPQRIALIAFFMAGILGGIGGILIAPVQFTAYNIGSSYSMRGFVAAVLGGFDSIVGALIGGLIIGVVEALAGVYISSSYQDVIVFAMLFLVIAIRPNGIIPSKLS